MGQKEYVSASMRRIRYVPGREGTRALARVVPAPEASNIQWIRCQHHNRSLQLRGETRKSSSPPMITILLHLDMAILQKRDFANRKKDVNGTRLGVM